MTPRDLSDEDEQQIIENGQRLSNLYQRFALPSHSGTPVGEAFAHACLARCHHTFASVLVLTGRSTDQLVLARSLYEHVITFGWLLIDAAKHYPMLEAWELKYRLDAIKDLQSHSLAPVPSADTVKRALVHAGEKRAPETPDRAFAADWFWRRAIPDHEFAFRRAYANLFRPCSGFVHPTTMGILPFKESDGTGMRYVHHPAPLGTTATTASVALFNDALVLSWFRFGRPPRRDIVSVFTHGLGDQKENNDAS